MNREAFDHAIRAAGAILGENELLVIGSQTFHALVPGVVPPEAARSMEVGVAALYDGDEQTSDLIGRKLDTTPDLCLSRGLRERYTFKRVGGTHSGTPRGERFLGA